jgi:PAS domain S-box-containing protein
MKRRFERKSGRPSNKARGPRATAIARHTIEDDLARIELQHSADLYAIRLLYDIGNLCVRPGVARAELLRSILRTAILLTRAHRGNIQLLDAASGCLFIAAHEGFEKPFLDYFARVAHGTTAACGEALASGKRFVVHDVKSEPLFAGRPALDVLLAAGVRAVQSTPLFSSAGNLLGMISTHFAHPHHPDERELQRLDLLARLAADYLEREQVEESLRESELRWRSMAQALPNLLWTTLPNGQCNWLSSQWGQYSGIPEKELLGLNWLHRVAHPDDRQRVAACRDAARAEHREYDIEYRIRRHDGEYRWFKARGVPVRDERGQLLYWLGTCTDIEDLKQAEMRERELRKRAEKASNIEAVFAQCGSHLGVLDLEGCLREVNDTAVDFSGYKREQVLGKLFWETPWWRGSSETQARVRAAVKQAAAGETFPETLPYWLADGTERIVEFAVIPIRNESGVVSLLHSAARDVTDRKRADDTMAHLAAIVENSDDAIITTDLNSNITSWNKAARRIFGHTADEVMGKPISIITAEDRQHEEPDILERIRRGQRVDHFETIRQRKDGTHVEVSLSVSPLRDAKGELIGASKIIRDITELRKAHSVATRSQEELEKRIAELTEAIGQMEEFSYSVSHDLRAPIRAMQGYAQTTLQEYSRSLDDRGREFLDNIIRGSARLDRLVCDLLTYSRAARGQLTLQPIALDTLVNDIISHYPEMQPPRAHITVHPDLKRVIAHEPSLTQAISNLLGNAVKFVAPGVTPSVQIYSETRGDRIRLCIEDNGIGIQPEHRRRLFGLFQRIHPEGTYEGTGVGLAVVRKAVERMGGKVGIESSRTGTGSTFWIELPPAAPAPSNEAETLLLIEDDPNDTFFFKYALQQARPDLSLQAVTDGREAMDYLNGLQQYSDRAVHPVPDFIFLDLKLPYLSGFDVLEHIRATPSLSDILVFVLTSSSEERDRKRALELGAKAYLVKPPSAKMLTETLGSLSAAIPSKQPLGGFELTDTS